MTSLKSMNPKVRIAAAPLALLALLLVLAAAPLRATETASATLASLRCEYKINPLGIDALQPQLSWIVESTERSWKQSAYRVLAASSEERLGRDEGDLWDSGKVESDETAHIEYTGKPLESHQLIYWKAQVWDAGGRASGWSETAFWSMGLLDPADWKAEWIGHDMPLTEKQRIDLQFQALNANLRRKKKVYRPSPYLLKSFTVEGPVRRATVYATALGLYELHLNGQRVGNDFFTPGWSDYRKRVYYQTYDVTGLLQSGGENVVGAVLADGWYAGNISNQGQRHYGNNLRLKAHLRIEYENGSVRTVVTDESWKAGEGGVREADIQDGETFDDRLEPEGWTEPGFDDSGWAKVKTGDKYAGLIQAYPGVPVRLMQAVLPVALTEPATGTFVFDMGQNFSGWAALNDEEVKPGDKVVLRFGERLNPDGTLYTENLRGARVTDAFIRGYDLPFFDWESFNLRFSGGEPMFTYRGFQYVEVTGYPGTPRLNDVVGIVAYSGLEQTGSIETSDPLVNKIFSNILWGQKSNYFEVPTDCPQRDERLGWTGDAQVFARTAAYNMDVAPFFAKWLVDLEDGQFEDGSFPSVAPQVHAGTAAGWGDAGVVCPWTMLRAYDDRNLIRKHYGSMTRWMDFLEKRSEDGTAPPLGKWGDWLHVDAPTPLDVISTAYYARSARLMEDMARAIGRDADADRYHRLFESVRAAFTAKFVSPDAEVSGDTQTAYLLALGFDLLPENLRARAAQRLEDRLRDRGLRTSTGFLGLALLLPALTETGRLDIAYHLLQERGYPSWGYTIDRGATTIWERWNGWTDETGFGDPGMNSFNHYAFGSVGEWMYSTMAGIDTDGPGYKRIVIRPRPGGDLQWVRARYESIRGLIRSDWSLEGEDLKMDVAIPANTTATVWVPAQSAEDVTEGGVPAAQAPGVRFLRMEPGAAAFKIGSGVYSFRSKGAKLLIPDPPSQ